MAEKPFGIEIGNGRHHAFTLALVGLSPDLAGFNRTVLSIATELLLSTMPWAN